MSQQNDFNTATSRLRFSLRTCQFVVLVLATAVPAMSQEESSDYIETPITNDDRLHWSFQPVAAVEVPETEFSAWCRTPIDNFIAAGLTENGLHPQTAAAKRTLIRRLYFDLVGLPPTPKQIDSYLQDSNDDAFSGLVDQLLASPGYGERWAQHWLDLARFAETDGFEHDKTRPEAWKYRDWVIQSLNEDMPYDEFVRQQIAGDELYPDQASAVIATAFCLSGPDMPDINLTEERRHTLLNEMTSTVGDVFLGLQIGCAQCHDHKYDPISQADFYRLRAAFEPAVQLQHNKSVTVLKEQFPSQQTSHVFLRGDFRRPGPEISPGILRVVSHDAFAPQATATTAGHRTAVAEWLVSCQNPLTARVIVNRVWQHHFGTGLVDTPSDFGLMGSEPSHRELLDWLSGWFVDNGWSLKKLHRIIVTSATWRQRSLLPDNATEEERKHWNSARQIDPSAKQLWRFPRRRLEGESIRDAMLAAAGRLNRKMGGAGVRPPLPKELVGTLLKNQWRVTEDTAEHDRRSIYVFARRNLRYPIFEVFDRPSANASCAVRGRSTTAPQSLHLLNSKFSLRMSQQLATAIQQNAGGPRAEIASAFVRTLGREPDHAEYAAADDFLSKHAQTAANPDEPLMHLCLSLFNCSEFLFID